MTDIYSDEYWLNEFTITAADLNRIQERILRDDTPFDTTSLVKQLIKGRLEFGHEIGPSVLKTWTGKDSVRVWDSFAKWSVGDGIIVPMNIGDVTGNYDDYECFIGEVISVDEIKLDHIEVRLDGQDIPKIFRCGHPDGVDTGIFTKDLVEKKYGEVDYIVLRFGNRIVSALLHALETDKRFIGLEGKWYLVHKLPIIEINLLKSMHQTLLEKDTFILDDMLPMIQPDDLINETLLKMAFQVALQKLPERFENIGFPVSSLWKALPPLPEKARVKYYAYDPITYEVLCSPEQHLPLESAQRMTELNLYNFMTTFMDGA